MKICICTTPIRPIQTTFPPFGSMAIIQALREIGEKPTFYNIDYFRYKNTEIEEYFSKGQFDIVGISAVVSTAYAYTKFLSSLIRRVSPSTIIIVGGNLAASSEILLRKCDVDLTVIGDGENTIKEVVKALSGRPFSPSAVENIKGVCFLDGDKFHFTGYGVAPPKDEISWPDYSILEDDNSISYFINEEIDGRAYGFEGVVEPGKKKATVVMSKGCVARCTFCHRFEKGYRARPAEQIINHVEFLIEKYNVGILDIADENFGSDKELAHEVADRLGKLGIIWSVAGVRTRTVSLESLKHWKENGCYMVLYGVESGSPKILSVMEKNVTAEINARAIKWTGQAGLGTVIQLVLGMPGEDDKTISETIDFLKDISSSMIWWKNNAPSDLISINYAQALPGTPLYEYGREHGLIGKSLDAEEQYLINISDTDAYKEDHFVNTSGMPLLKVLMWRPLITAHIDFHQFSNLKNQSSALTLWQVAKYYIDFFMNRLARKFKINPNNGSQLTSNENELLTDNSSRSLSETGYFNIHKGLKFFPLLANKYTNRSFYIILAIATAFKSTNSIYLLKEHVVYSLKQRFNNKSYAIHTNKSPTLNNLNEKSLRRTITIVPSDAELSEKNGMVELRKGR